LAVERFAHEQVRPAPRPCAPRLRAAVARCVTLHSDMSPSPASIPSVACPSLGIRLRSSHRCRELAAFARRLAAALRGHSISSRLLERAPRPELALDGVLPRFEAQPSSLRVGRAVCLPPLRHDHRHDTARPRHSRRRRRRFACRVRAPRVHACKARAPRFSLRGLVVTDAPRRTYQNPIAP